MMSLDWYDVQGITFGSSHFPFPALHSLVAKSCKSGREREKNNNKKQKEFSVFIPLSPNVAIHVRP